MTGRKKADGGYALVEIILSIGILALVSLYVIQMFVLAASTQSKAVDLDAACLLAQEAVEEARMGNVKTGDFYYTRHWTETNTREDDGYTLSGYLLETSPPSYMAQVRKNSDYVYFLEERRDETDIIFALSITLYGYGEEAAG